MMDTKEELTVEVVSFTAGNNSLMTRTNLTDHTNISMTEKYSRNIRW